MVYWLKANGAGIENVHVTPTEAGGLIPNLLVYNQGNLVQYDDSYWNSDRQQEEIHTTLSLQAGQTYAFVVGGANGQSTGGYQIRVNASGEETTLQNPDGSLSSLYSDLSQVPPYEQTTVQSTVLGSWSGLSVTPGVQGTTRLVGVGTFLPSRPPATLADPAGDVPVALREAEVLSLGSDPSFVASAQDPDLPTALAEIATAQMPADVAVPGLNAGVLKA